MLTICNIKEWFAAKVYSTKKLEYSEFVKLFEKNCTTFKKNSAIFYKPHAANEQFLFCKASSKKNENNMNWKTYPSLVWNVKCYNYKHNTNLNNYVLIPFDGTRFGIVENSNETSKILEHQDLADVDDPADHGYKIGLYINPVEWTKKISKSELWLDSNCLLVREDVYHKIKNKLKKHTT